LCFASATFLMGAVLAVDDTWYFCDLFVQSFGNYFQRLFQIGFHTGAFARHSPPPDGQGEPQGWMNDWTVFYKNWWVCWSPFVGTFFAIISKGRTIREFIHGTLIFPVLYEFVWFVVFGGAGLKMERAAQGAGLGWHDLGPKNVCHQIYTDRYTGEPVMQCGNVWRLNGFDSDMMWFNTLDQYGGLGTFFGGVTIIAAGLLLATSSDSASQVIDKIAANGVPDSPVTQRAFWSICEGAAGISLLYATRGAPMNYRTYNALKALQSACMATGFFFTGLLSFFCLAMWRAMKYDTGDLRWDGPQFALSLLDHGISLYPHLKFDWVRLSKLLVGLVAPWVGLGQARDVLDGGRSAWTVFYRVVAGICFYTFLILLIFDVLPTVDYIARGSHVIGTNVTLSARYGIFHNFSEYNVGKVPQSAQEGFFNEEAGVGPRIGASECTMTIAWFFYIVVVCMLTQTRYDVRMACEIEGEVISDFFCALLLPWNVAVQCTETMAVRIKKEEHDAEELPRAEEGHPSEGKDRCMRWQQIMGCCPGRFVHNVPNKGRRLAVVLGCALCFAFALSWVLTTNWLCFLFGGSTADCWATDCRAEMREMWCNGCSDEAREQYAEDCEAAQRHLQHVGLTGDYLSPSQDHPYAQTRRIIGSDPQVPAKLRAELIYGVTGLLYVPFLAAYLRRVLRWRSGGVTSFMHVAGATFASGLFSAIAWAHDARLVGARGNLGLMSRTRLFFAVGVGWPATAALCLLLIYLQSLKINAIEGTDEQQAGSDFNFDLYRFTFKTCAGAVVIYALDCSITLIGYTHACAGLEASCGHAAALTFFPVLYGAVFALSFAFPLMTGMSARSMWRASRGISRSLDPVSSRLRKKLFLNLVLTFAANASTFGRIAAMFLQGPWGGLDFYMLTYALDYLMNGLCLLALSGIMEARVDSDPLVEFALVRRLACLEEAATRVHHELGYDLLGEKIRRLEKPLRASVRAYGGALAEALREEPEAMCKLMSITGVMADDRRFAWVGLVDDDLEAPNGHRSPGTVLQHTGDLPTLLCEAVQAQAALKAILAPGSAWAATVVGSMNASGEAGKELEIEKEAGEDNMDSRYLRGISLPGFVDVAIDPGTKREARIREKASFKYPDAHGKPQYDHVRDIARIALQMDTAERLVEAIRQLLTGSFFEILEVENRFARPTALGWMDVSFIVRVPLQDGGSHIAELQVQLLHFQRARKSAHRYYTEIRSALPGLGVRAEDVDRVLALILIHLDD